MNTPLIGEKLDTVLLAHEEHDDGELLFIDEVTRMQDDNQHNLVALVSPIPNGAVARAAVKLKDAGIALPFFHFKPPYEEERYDWLLYELESSVGLPLGAILIFGWHQRILIPSALIRTF